MIRRPFERKHRRSTTAEKNEQRLLASVRFFIIEKRKDPSPLLTFTILYLQYPYLSIYDV